MYQCPNCGGNLKFHIPTQQLMCDYCQTQLNPYSFQKDKDADESTEYEATIFRCPQCGGEIISSDNTAAAFCSFCGASTILDSRISHEKRPLYILPFSKTKEDCKNSYEKMIKRAIFAPDDLKKKEFIDGFRGIYMPYWVYRIRQNNFISIPGSKQYRRGDYIYTDHYALNCTVDADYNGLSFDASSSFDDSISEAIAPYDVTKVKPFTPAFLSGFYADTADVKKESFISKAEDIANEETRKRILSIPEFSSFEKNNSTAMIESKNLNTKCNEISNAMFPVWFLSYRNGNRVAYATVNGQTGKVSADLPVDEKKYILGSLILAIPIFILLNIMFVLTPKTLLMLTAICSILAAIINTKEISQIKDNGEWNDLSRKNKLTGTTASIFAAIISIATVLINPVSDLIFYSVAIISLVCIIGSIIDIIRKYNILSTRKLPQFDRTGGDDIA